MATLTLEIGGSYAEASANGGNAMVAELVRFGADGRTDKGRSVTVLPSQPSSVQFLEAGSWEIRILTPGGAIISRDVDLAADESKSVQISLSEQAVGLPARRKPGGVKPVLVARAGTRRRGGLFTKGLGLDGAGERFAGGAIASVAPSVRTFVGDRSRDTACGHPVDLWARLAAGVDGSVGAEQMLDAREIVVREDDTPPGGAFKVRPPEGMPQEARLWLAVTSGERRRIHAAPSPWTPFDWGDEVLLGTIAAADGGIQTRITLADQRYAGIVTYLANGAVATAAIMLRGDQSGVLGSANAMLRGKGECPLGAAAAGYVLIGSANLSVDAPWRQWITNLCDWYPLIPDGAVLEARLRLLTARTAADAREVLPLLHEALCRGLPYYSVGLGWLLASMTFFEDDEIIQRTRPFVERVAAALDMDAPFTTLDVKVGS